MKSPALSCSRSIAMPLFLICMTAHGGTGWVGNAPLRVAYNDTQAMLSSMLPEVNSGATPKNHFLLNDGGSRLTLGFGTRPTNGSARGTSMVGNIGGMQGILGFDYGLSKSWTLMNLTSLVYDLRSGKEDGNDLAFYFGLPHGIGYGDTTGLSVGPGVGLLHSVGIGRWRFTNSLNLGAYYEEKAFDAHWISASVSLQTGVGLSLGDLWAIGLTAQSGYGIFTVQGLEPDNDGNLRVTSEDQIAGGWVLENPTLSLSRKLGEQSTITGGASGGIYDFQTGFHAPDYFMTLTTEW